LYFIMGTSESGRLLQIHSGENKTDRVRFGLLQVTDDLHELVHLSGVLRGLEGAGQAVSYGIAGSSASKWVSIGLGFA
jgi:hypothetical protein